MQTIAENLTKRYAGPRPLQALTKAQLFRYPDADPSMDAGWAFTKEVLARRAAWAHLQEKTMRVAEDEANAQARIGRAEAAVIEAKEKIRQASAQGLSIANETAHLTLTETGLKGAKAWLTRLKKDIDEIRARMVNIETQDDVISEGELQAYYAAKHGAEWNEILTQWANGTLLTAQRHGWLAFLNVGRPEFMADNEAYRKAEICATLVGQDNGPTFQPIRALWIMRVMPPLAGRREFLTDGEEGGSVAVASLKPEQKSRYWAWWKNYNSATLRHKWIDDSGVAYDTRLFNPEQTTDQE